jgi:hypothetical protein
MSEVVDRPRRKVVDSTRRPKVESSLDELLDKLIDFEFDPAGFVAWAFPWGQRGALETKAGPEPWQLAVLERIGVQLRAGGERGAVIREVVASGHGVGKSALVGWLILWAVSTKVDTKGVITANTATQLATKTWAELGKWYQLFIAKPLFTFNATSLVTVDKSHVKTWRIDAIPWSIETIEAFAGLHNEGKRILLLFDEASAIDDPIWETSEGALTDAMTQIIWCAFGNPTRTTGRFHRECSQPKRFKFTNVDSRNVSFTNKAEIEEWITDYGEDSDFVRVRVKGLFPRAGFSNFIGPEAVMAAMRREVPLMAYQALGKVMSIDPARFGDDSTIITLRQGLKVHWQIEMAGFDGVDVGGRVVELIRKTPGIMAVIYDASGNGADLDSILRRTPNMPPLVPIMWHIPARDSDKFFNQRAEAWGRMKEWIAHGELPMDDKPGGLADQMCSLDYSYDMALRIQLQSKKDIKKNGGKSPDKADSLALSFLLDTLDRKVTRAVVRPVERRKIIWSNMR